MEHEFITARECITKLNDLFGVKLSESSFNKYKNTGLFKGHRQKGRKRERYIFMEIAESYFASVGLTDPKRAEARRRFKEWKKKEIARAEDIQRAHAAATILRDLPKFAIDMFELEDKGSWTEKEIEEFKSFLIEVNTRNEIVAESTWNIYTDITDTFKTGEMFTRVFFEAAAGCILGADLIEFSEMVKYKGPDKWKTNRYHAELAKRSERRNNEMATKTHDED